jgi:hypothetical protein
MISATHCIAGSHLPILACFSILFDTLVPQRLRKYGVEQSGHHCTQCVLVHGSKINFALDAMNNPRNSISGNTHTHCHFLRTIHSHPHTLIMRGLIFWHQYLIFSARYSIVVCGFHSYLLISLFAVTAGDSHLIISILSHDIQVTFFTYTKLWSFSFISSVPPCKLRCKKPRLMELRFTSNAPSMQSHSPLSL